MNYRSIADLNLDIKRWIPELPNDLDLIVGIPRSGMLVANLLSLYLNLPLTDVEGLCEGRIFQSGPRLDSIRINVLSKINKILVVDDSVYSGTQMKKIKVQLSGAGIPHKIYYGAVYVSPEGYKYVDFWYKNVDLPRIFEWNIMHHGVLTDSCLDIDGVLCRDPSPQENDDGDKYRQFISTVNPLVVPTKTVGWLVTCRLEKYRELTEKWLKEHGIKYNHLMMMDLPDKETRIALGTHADFKAKVYKTTNAALFIESSYSQAQEIARRAGKTVFCTETWQIVDQNYLIGGYKRGKELIGKAMINPLKAPFRILSFTKRKLSMLRWKILAKLKKNRSTRHS